MNWRRRRTRTPAVFHVEQGGAEARSDQPVHNDGADVPEIAGDHHAGGDGDTGDRSVGVVSSEDVTDAVGVAASAGPMDDDAPDRSGRIVCITNQKGGVGKTTTAVSVAAALAAKGLRVLLVDVDPQRNASTGLDVRVAAGTPSSYHVMVDRLPPRAAIVASGVAGLDVLPSSIDLAGAEVELVSQLNRERRLSRALEDVRGDYHVILLDCPPSLGILTLNALVAADEAVVPIQTEYYALEGVTQLLTTLELVQDDLNEDLHIGGVVLTMYDARTNLSQQVADEIRAYFGDRTYTTIIPRTVRLSEAPSYGQPITVFDPGSRGARAYERLATEMAVRWGLVAPTNSPLDGLLGPVATGRDKETAT